MFKTTINLGKIDFNGSGRKNCKVTIEVEIKPVHPSFLTWNLTPVPEDAVELSICGNIWNPRETDTACGGQCRDAIREFFIGNKNIQRLCDIWDEYHLNGLKSGTREQTEALRDMPKAAYPGSHYDKACAWLKDKNLLEVPYPDGRYTKTDGLGRSEPAKYKYGSAWLYQPIPQAIIDEVKSICEALYAEDRYQSSGKVDEVDDSLESFCVKHGISMAVNHVDSNPHMNDDGRDPGANHYECVFKCGKKKFTTYFSKGSALKGKPTIVEVLGCIAQDSQSCDCDFEEWASNCGYDVDSRAAEKIFNTCRDQALKLEKFLGEKLYAELLKVELA